MSYSDSNYEPSPWTARCRMCAAAIEQLVLAQKSGDGDFYQQSSVDARLRELRAIDKEMRKEDRNKR